MSPKLIFSFTPWVRHSWYTKLGLVNITKYITINIFSSFSFIISCKMFVSTSTFHYSISLLKFFFPFHYSILIPLHCSISLLNFINEFHFSISYLHFIIPFRFSIPPLCHFIILFIYSILLLLLLIIIY